MIDDTLFMVICLTNLQTTSSDYWMSILIHNTCQRTVRQGKVGILVMGMICSFMVVCSMFELLTRSDPVPLFFDPHGIRSIHLVFC